MMQQQGAIPGSPNEITADWLTEVFHAAGILRTQRVTGVTWHTIGEEFGFTGVLARLTIRATGAAAYADLPLSLVAKFPLAERHVESAYRAAQRRDTDMFRRYFARCAREVWFYQTLARESGALIPRLYHGAVDGGAGHIVLLLEDMRDAQSGDALRGCTPDEALQVLRAIGGFHARWWGGRANTRDWLPRWSSDHVGRQERYRGQIEPFLARFGAQVPPPIHDLIVRLGPRYASILESLSASSVTLIHADLHLDNIMFRAGHSTSRVVLLDWQSVSRGPVAVDLVNFLVGSLDPHVRRAHEAALLRAYHATLVAAGVADYSPDRLYLDYRLTLLWLLARTVGWLMGVDPDRLTGRERALIEAAIGDGRLFTALLDHDVAALLT